jgi:hypothetical protein
MFPVGYELNSYIIFGKEKVVRLLRGPADGNLVREFMTKNLGLLFFIHGLG